MTEPEKSFYQSTSIRVEEPKQVRTSLFIPQLREVDVFVRATEARSTFHVSGSGLCVAGLDTGLRASHIDFAGRVATQVNYTDDSRGDRENASDGQGHGTNVAGIIVANGVHRGIAPDARIIPIKVLPNRGGGSFEDIIGGLRWVNKHHSQYQITCVCMSLGDASNHQNDEEFLDFELNEQIKLLKEKRIAVVVASGNDYFRYDSEQGMSFPAILRDTISVGAVYDSDEGEMYYYDGAIAYSTKSGQITPFSQRLHESVNNISRTDIFAPGAVVTSSGIKDDRSESVQQGTSQATPVIAGVVLLLQQLHFRETNKLPEIDEIVAWLRAGSVTIIDGDDERDNVDNTHKEFLRVDAVLALDVARRALLRRNIV